jgi:hypothetical protein
MGKAAEGNRVESEALLLERLEGCQPFMQKLTSQTKSGGIGATAWVADPARVVRYCLENQTGK